MADKNSVSSEMIMVIALLLRTAVASAVWLTNGNPLFFNIKIEANTLASDEERLCTFLVKESCSQQFPQSSEKQNKTKIQDGSIITLNQAWCPSKSWPCDWPFLPH